MKVKNLKYHINWRDTWNKMREERVRKPKVSYDDAFFKKSAQDFSQRVKSNDMPIRLAQVSLSHPQHSDEPICHYITYRIVASC